MRPLHLTVSGLHSYREPVSVDFEDLGRYGLFGIFGRIGSGKSTLLDAMTLALYGLVDRVTTRSRKGLVNQHCSTLEVRFRFAVGAPDGSDAIYEVHRQYRDDDGVAQRVASRLVHLGDAEQRIVIADKEREVLEAVIDLVGLTSEDFMRAVVLPQGRFMQVLHLKGAERRQMLQRIFKLGAYGEGVRRRIKVRRDALRTQLAGHRGELQGLGDASVGAQRAAASELQRAARARKCAQSTHAKARAAHEAARTVRERQHQLEQATEELTTHQARRDHIQASQQRIAAADQLRPLLGPGRRWLAARDARDAARVAVVADTGRAAHAARTLQQAESAHAAQRARTQARDPTLRQRRATLEEATRWGDAREGVAGRAQQLVGELESVARKLADGAGRLLHAEEAVRSGADRRNVLRKQWSTCKVSAEERERVQRAFRSAQALQRSRELVAEARSEHERLAKLAKLDRQQLDDAQSASAEGLLAVEAAREVVAEAEADPALLDAEALDAHADQVARSERLAAQRAERIAAITRTDAAMASADELLSICRTELRSATRARRRARKVLEGAEGALSEALDARYQIARAGAPAALAATLVAHSACPVCGSHDHPEPADVHDGARPSGTADEHAVVSHHTGRQRALERFEAAVARHAAAERGAELAAARAGDARAQAAVASDALRVHDRSLAALMADLGERPIEPTAMLSRLASLRQADVDARRRCEGARQRVAELERAQSEVQGPSAAAQARLASAEQALEQAASQLALRTSEEGTAWDLLDRDSGDLTLFDIPPAVARLEALDRQAELTVRELDTVEARLSDATRARDDLRASVAHLHKDQAQLRERSDAAAAQLSELDARIQQATEGADPAAAIAAVRAELHALQRDLETARAACQVAREAQATASLAAATTEATAVAADTAVTQAREALDEVTARHPRLAGLDGPPLASALAEMHRDALDDASLAALRAEVQAWSQREQALRARVTLLGDQLGAARVDPDAWSALCEALTAADAALDLARDAAIGAERRRAELEARAGRFAELSEVIAALDTQLTRLDSLAHVLRGDRFVEFIANDYLRELAHGASVHLAQLTQGRYGLELDDSGSFLVRDDDAGGSTRPVHTLSGGETFLTSLALALALSAQVQARSTRPLEFFFLDEGFGTLDAEALDRVMTAIESLRSSRRLIGLISHVPAVRERVPRFLRVHPPGVRGAGSVVELCDG